jgi:hypothetical protein
MVLGGSVGIKVNDDTGPYFQTKRGSERTLMSPRGEGVNRRDDQLKLFLP